MAKRRWRARSDRRQALAFSGIHVISPRIFSLHGEKASEAFPIIPAYLRLAAREKRSWAIRAGNDYWRDLGTAASLQQAAEDMEQKVDCILGQRAAGATAFPDASAKRVD